MKNTAPPTTNMTAPAYTSAAYSFRIRRAFCTTKPATVNITNVPPIHRNGVTCDASTATTQDPDAAPDEAADVGEDVGDAEGEGDVESETDDAHTPDEPEDTTGAGGTTDQVVTAQS